MKGVFFYKEIHMILIDIPLLKPYFKPAIFLLESSNFSRTIWYGWVSGKDVPDVQKLLEENARLKAELEKKK
ncbi:hypothetical protein O0550_22720 [Brevibacillus halotolerans]|uniref:hypothetical protein n=1 Tax=Brevibacillus laterosporus TaxID=1465 RepID=UPI00215D329F|nr:MULTISPECIES: hypothetical protein [Brevibacillus]MCR8965964.1 hypothetical protein [Brevibacillus laterosporus]MCZ0838120.1 hypothetical protein [Brevibacillus halotolerans]